MWAGQGCCREEGWWCGQARGAAGKKGGGVGRPGGLQGWKGSIVCFTPLAGLDGWMDATCAGPAPVFACMQGPGTCVCVHARARLLNEWNYQ